jgi:hypothetical protein
MRSYHLRGFDSHHVPKLDDASDSDAKHSRLILLAFCLEATTRSQLPKTLAIVAVQCIRAAA